MDEQKELKIEKEEKRQANEGENRQENRTSYPPFVRIVALVAAGILLVLYFVTLYAGLTTSPASPTLFKACIGATILAPIILWFCIRLAGHLSGKK